MTMEGKKECKEETSLGKQFSGLNCINFDMLNLKWLLIRAQSREKEVERR